MTLTLSHGPLARRAPATVNYTIDGPDHRLLADAFPRRVRAVFADEVVLDTTDGVLVHETGHLPVLYVPEADLRTELLEASDHASHCPYKGDAAYRSIVVGDRRSPDAVWHYPDPVATAPWLAGLAALYWDRVDAWFDEDERVEGHLRDPYHRVDVRRSSRHVRVTVDGLVVAETGRPMLLSETGLPNRWYVPPADVDRSLLRHSTTRSVCAYKGEADWWSLRDGTRDVPDVGWSYADPLDDAARVAGHVAFAGTDRVTVTVDGEVAEG